MLRKRSLRFQMAIVLLMMIVIITIFGRVQYAYFEKQYAAKLLEINEDVTTQLANAIATQYHSLLAAQASFSVNATVNRFLSTDSEYEKLTLIPMYESLRQDYKKMNPCLLNIVLQKKDGTVFSDPTGNNAVNITHIISAFTQVEKGTSTALMISECKAYIAISQAVYQLGEIRKQVGNCMFVIAADELMGQLSQRDSDIRELFVVDQEQLVIAHNDSTGLGEALPTRYTRYMETGRNSSQQDGEYIIVSRHIPDTGWTILCTTPKDAVFSELNSIKYMSYLLLALMLLMISVVYLFQEQLLSRAFRRFITHINAIADGSHVQPLNLQYSVEFHQLAEAFNRMMRKLEDLNANNLAYHEKILMQNIENKQSQLLALQSQINPHFLYNTLECINSAGAVCGSREVEEMSTALAFIFRYAIKGENIVTLQAELDMLQYYLSIQQIRFPNVFTIHYEIPQTLKSKRLLKFMLQPMVENSILHGFRECTPPCVIRIAAKEEEGKLVLVIADNGTGIELEKLAALQERLDNPEQATDSIGLMNIQRRLRLYYGEAFGLVVQSIFGKGTVITAMLPLDNDKKEDVHV